MANNRKRIMSLVLCAGILLAGCGSTAQEETADSAVVVDASKAERGTLVLSNQFVGTVSPEESVYIIPLAQGTVTETFFEVGDEVQAGDVLFKIDDSGAKLQLQQAQLSYTSAQQQADSALTTQQDSANLQLDTSVSAAEAQYVSAQAAWKTAGDAVDDLDDQVSAQKKIVKQLKESGADEADIKAANTLLNTLKDSKSKAEVQYNAAEAAYRAAETAYETAKSSRELTQGEALEDTKEQLSTSLQLAKVAVESAQLALSYYQVTTPISGKVISKNVEVNGMATSSSAAYIIAGDDTMVVTFQVSESIMNTLKQDQKIVVERNGAEYEGVITEVGNAVNAQTGLFQIKAAVYADGSTLPSGVSVKITSDTYTAKDDIIIPYDAVYYENDGSYVYTVQDGCAVKTYVTTGIFDDTSIQITDGISEGDVVITSWSPRLLDGVEVDAKVAEPDSAQQ
jgi:RND family efflux transporter MFP subunit